MASAGQAQAHSSHPMHFSRPSGCRLRTCRPWYRGAVGRLSSGYWTVATFLNMVPKVTPKPLKGLRISSTVDALRGVIGVAGRSVSDGLRSGSGKGADRDRTGCPFGQQVLEPRDRERTGGDDAAEGDLL